MQFKRSLVVLAAIAVCASSFAANFIRVPTGAMKGSSLPSSHPATSALSGGGTNPTTPTTPEVPPDTTPVLVVSPGLLDFGSTPVDTSPAIQQVLLRNSGKGPASLEWSTALPFQISSTSCSASLAVGAECTLGVRFTPQEVGAKEGTLSIASNGGNASVQLRAVAEALPVSTVDVSPSGSHSFGTSVVIASTVSNTYTLSNSGNAPATNVVASLSGAADMSIATNSCGTSQSPGTLAAGASCTVKVNWTPAADGQVTGTLQFAGTATTGLPRTVTMTGTAIYNGTVVLVSPALNGKTQYDLDTEKMVFTTPGVYTLQVKKGFTALAKAWGGGGTSAGAAGGYVSGSAALAASTTLTVRVDAQGGSGGQNLYNSTSAGAGGGLAGLFAGSSATQGSALLVAGGGAGGNAAGTGGAAGGAVGSDGVHVGTTACKANPMYGRGGTQSAGGAAGTPYDTNAVLPSAGGPLSGGNGGTVNSASWGPGGGGGGGYFGGGGSAGGGSCKGTAGGGSSYVSASMSSGVNAAGSGTTPGNSGDSDRGGAGSPGTTGRVVISKN